MEKTIIIMVAKVIGEVKSVSGLAVFLQTSPWVACYVNDSTTNIIYIQGGYIVLTRLVVRHSSQIFAIFAAGTVIMQCCT